MTFGEIYRELRRVGGWAQESRKVLVLAARYYSGVDSYEDLWAWTEPQETGVSVLPPVLSVEKAKMIVDLR